MGERVCVYSAEEAVPGPPPEIHTAHHSGGGVGGGGWGGGVGGPLCGGFSSLENISCECGRGSVPDCCLLLAEMAQCPGGKSFKVFVRLRLHRDRWDATGTDHPTLPLAAPPDWFCPESGPTEAKL